MLDTEGSRGLAHSQALAKPKPFKNVWKSESLGSAFQVLQQRDRIVESFSFLSCLSHSALVSGDHSSCCLQKTWPPRECPTAEVLGSVTAWKKFDSVSLELSAFAKYTGFDKTALSVIFIKGVWVESYPSAVLTWQVSL